MKHCSSCIKQSNEHCVVHHRDQEAEDSLRRELSRHLRFCLQSTPMNVSQLQPLWFLLSSDRVSTKKNPKISMHLAFGI